MIRHLLEGSKFILMFFILFSCKENKKENNTKYSYPQIIIKQNLKKEILSYRAGLTKFHASKNNSLSICFNKKNDTTFIEMGDYKPNFKMLNIRGVEIIKEDTIYLFSENNQTGIEEFFENKSNEKIDIIDNLKLPLNHYDPHYRCFYLNNDSLKVLFFGGRCR